MPEGQPALSGSPVTHLTLQCVAAALQGPCLKAVMRLAIASADPGLMALTVTAASQATTVTLTVMVSRELGREGVRPSPQDGGLTPHPHPLCPQLVPVTLGGPWINTVERVARAAAVLATQAPLAGSAAPASMASPAASVSSLGEWEAGSSQPYLVPTDFTPQPATALPMVPGIQPVTLQRGSVAAGPE